MEHWYMEPRTKTCGHGDFILTHTQILENEAPRKSETQPSLAQAACGSGQTELRGEDMDSTIPPF